MGKVSSNPLLIYTLLLIPALLLWSSVVGRLYPIHLSGQTPFFFDLIEFHKTLPSWSIYLFGAVNFLLIFILAKPFFNKWQTYIPVFLFSIAPWNAYLTSAGSFYIYLLTLLLIALLGVRILILGKKKLGTAIFIVSSTLILYSSLIMLIISPFLILGVYLTKTIPINTVNKSILLIVILALPLFIFMVKNPAGLKNIFVSEVGIFSDPGLIGNVNKFQGESNKEGLLLAARMAENKYIYLTEHTILKVLKHLYPLTYFTSQEALLNFSFSPPVFLGFVIPLLYGLFFIIRQGSYRRFLIFPLILLLPSVFSKTLVDLNRLVLVLPFAVFIITFGITRFYQERSKRLHKFVFAFCIILSSVQFLVTLADINLREYARFERKFNINFEIGK